MNASKELLCAINDVVEAAWVLCDNTSNADPPVVEQKDWNALSDALDKVEAFEPEGASMSAGSIVEAVFRPIPERLQKAIELLERCYQSGHREGWQPGDSTNEVMEDVRDFLDDVKGNHESA